MQRGFESGAAPRLTAARWTAAAVSGSRLYDPQQADGAGTFS